MIILWILGYLLLFLLIILGVVLIVPFEYALRGHRYAHYQIEAEILWLFRLIKVSFIKKQEEEVSFLIALLGFKKMFNIHKDRNSSPFMLKKKDNKKKNKATIEKKKKEWKDFMNGELLEKVVVLVKKLILHMRPEKFQCFGHFGFEDPYYTGIGCATLYTFSPILEDYNLHLTPHFEGKKLEGRFYIKGKILVILLLFYICKLIFSKPVRKILWHLIKEEQSYGI